MEDGFSYHLVPLLQSLEFGAIVNDRVSCKGLRRSGTGTSFANAMLMLLIHPRASGRI